MKKIMVVLAIAMLFASCSNPVMPNYFTATFVVDGITIDEQEILEGDKASAPADPVKTGYRFDGWSPSIDTAITEDTIFTAQFTDMTDDRLVGTWINGPFSMILKDDGTAESTVPGFADTGIWSTDNGFITIDWNSTAGIIDTNNKSYTVNDTTLTFDSVSYTKL